MKTHHTQTVTDRSGSPVAVRFQPASVIKNASFRCISCEEDTPLKKGRELYDRVTGRNQFFCYPCYNATLAAARKLRG